MTDTPLGSGPHGEPTRVVIVDATSGLATGGASVAPTATFTPAAAAYSAGDVMDVAKEITLSGPSAGAIRILSAELLVSESAVQSGETSYRLQLYSVTPPSALADNAAWDIPSGDRASYLGYVDLGSPVDVGASLYVQSLDINKDLKLAGTSLFGYLQTIGAFTATATARKVTLHTMAL